MEGAIPEGWQKQMQQLQSEASFFGPLTGDTSHGMSRGIPPLPRKFMPRGSFTQSSTEVTEATQALDPSFLVRGPRPGVDEASYLRSAQCIQRRWRELLQYRHLLLAKKHLAEGYVEVGAVETAFRKVRAEAPSRTSRLPEWTCSLPAEELWDEALFFRQPSVHQVLQAQLRWCHQEEAQEELMALGGETSLKVIEDMQRLEGDLQLRVGGSTWRPPCALSACLKRFQAVLEAAEDAGGSIPYWLLPIASLFQLTLASSYMHHMELTRSSKQLDQLEASLHAAPAGSYAEAVSPALHARCTLQRASFASWERRYDAVELAARDAIQMLEERGSPKDFWPPHCWELATCRRLVVVAQCAASGRAASRALGELQALWPLLADASPVSGVTLGRLKEDMKTLQLEVEVVVDVDQYCSEKCGVSSSTLQAFLRRAQALAQDATNTSRTRLQLLQAKLILLEELPWFVAGGARREAIQKAYDWLMSVKAFYTKWCTTFATSRWETQVLPAEAICLALMDDNEGALQLAQRWAEVLPEAAAPLVTLLSSRRHPVAKVPGAMQVLAQGLAKVARPC